MPTTITTYRCLVISPSDVVPERDIIEKVIADWNAHVGGGLDARIEAIRWESHARPDMGGHPQEIINQQIVDSCDFGIAIFWSRLGSPTREHESGSAEEIARLLAKGSRVMVYFCTRPIPQDAALSQFPKLQELKKRYQEQGLLGSFSESSELRSTVNLHITSLMSNLLLKSRASGQPIPSTGTLTAPTPDIRVTTTIGFSVQRDPRKFLCIGVQNHSPMRFYARPVMLERKDGSQLLCRRDAVTGRENVSREIEPGDSFDFYIDGDDDGLWESMETNHIVCAVIQDKIGRVFRGSADRMATVLARLRADRQR